MATKGSCSLSVVIRVHGRQPYLLNSIHSALSQVTSFSFDVWLILDRPDPQVYEDLETISDSRLKVYHPKSVGPAEPVNELFEFLSGDLVAILDADDMMEPNRLQLQYEFLAKNQEVAVVGSSVFLIDERGNRFGVKIFPTDRHTIYEQRYRKLPVAHPSIVFRKSSIIDVGSYRSYYDFAEDFDLWLRVLDRYEIANLNEFLTSYRIHPKQTTSTFLEKNVLAAVAARISGKRRSKGLIDLSESTVPISKLMLDPRIFVEVKYRVTVRKCWNQASESIKDKNFKRLILPVIGLLFLDTPAVFRKLLQSGRST